jgi:putative serine protease PepD
MLMAALAGAAAASAALLFLGAGTGRSAPAARARAASAQGASRGSRQEVSSPSSSALTASQIYQRDAAGVVSIKAVTPEGEDSGTGIVLNQDGLILTNDHVIAHAQSITVSPGRTTGTERTATLVGEEASSDLALIRVEPSGLVRKPLNLVSSSSIEVGGRS